MSFGPQNRHEALTFAVEELRAALQYEMLRALDEEGVSQSALAERLGCSPSWVSQLLDDDANLTLESIAKVFLAVGRRCVPSTEPSDYVDQWHGSDNEVQAGEWWQVSNELPVAKTSANATGEFEKLLIALSRDHDSYVGPANDNYSEKRLELEAA